jgi:hypothetical protein
MRDRARQSRWDANKEDSPMKKLVPVVLAFTLLIASTPPLLAAPRSTRDGDQRTGDRAGADPIERIVKIIKKRIVVIVKGFEDLPSPPKP